MPETIGFIGLGIMGKPMAHNLLKAGYSLIVLNRHQEVTDEFVAQGARSAQRPGDVAAKSDIVITMLPNSPQVEEVLAGPQGVLEGAHKGLTVIDMSTISPIVTQRLAEQLDAAGVEMLDAPVSGGDKGAIAGTLSIMVGGNEAVFQRCQPIFQKLGKTIVHVGGHGAGQIVKACNQIVVALTIEAVGEALVLGSKAGVDPAKILQVLGGGLAGNRVMEMRGPNMLSHNFEPGFRINLHRKDLDIALSAGHAYDVSLPVTALVDQMFSSLVVHGRGNLDHSALLTYLEDLANHKIGEDTQE
ncbi:2-hydroxy-3-oxopropionate reductase [Ktedonosporobacter rubrisoli]|uniref:2-hydroxy-3-oxopropionate reductase n=1 Tax=Ktedonosporobacter rubrisoli TaxID=2509675 RepID=A0A4P6JT56_KTERU|nr:2-hydroxy-3-oxopropionate reductase [Ktedonosporobacter rubrisoli]QBD78747.1 2-hydroxy-3-oxopropionate reductase [Ktedonosporobacter rubrisoli]